MMVQLLAWPLALGLLGAAAWLFWQQRRLTQPSWLGLWAGGACAAGLAALGFASRALGAGVWIETLLAVPVFVAAAALQAALFVVGSSPTSSATSSATSPAPQDNGRIAARSAARVTAPQWPALLCVATLIAIVVLAMQAPDAHRSGVCGLLAVHMVIAARLAWWQCGRLDPSLALPMLLLVPALAALTAALLLDQAYRLTVALAAASFIVLLAAWLLLVQYPVRKTQAAPERRAPSAVRHVLVQHFSRDVAPAVVLLRFGLTLRRVDGEVSAGSEAEAGADAGASAAAAASAASAPVALDSAAQEWAMTKAVQVLRQHFRADDRIIREADGQWAVICADVEPAQAAGLADRVARQIGAQRFADAHGQPVQLCLSAGVSVRCESLAACEPAWQQAGHALHEAKVATLGNGPVVT